MGIEVAAGEDVAPTGAEPMGPVEDHPPLPPSLNHQGREEWRREEEDKDKLPPGAKEGRTTPWLAQLISGNASLQADNATLVAKLAEGDQHRAAQHFSLADVYTWGEEGNEEYTQKNGSIGVRAAAAQEAGRTGPGNDTKRTKTGLIGRRPPT